MSIRFGLLDEPVENQSSEPPSHQVGEGLGSQAVEEVEEGMLLFLFHLRGPGHQNTDDVQKAERLPERDLEPDVGKVHRPERGDDLGSEEIDGHCE